MQKTRPNSSRTTTAMDENTMQDIATAWGNDALTFQLDDIPLLASPEIADYIQSMATQASPTMSNLFAEFLEEAPLAPSYPSPTQTPTDPYPLTQQSQTPSQPMINWPLPIDIPQFDDFPGLDLNLINADQIQTDFFPTNEITDTIQMPAYFPPAQLQIPTADSSFLLYGSQPPIPTRQFAPLTQRKSSRSEDSDSTDPENLALSDFETDTPRPSKIRKTDGEGSKSARKPIARAGGVDRDKPWIKTNRTKGLNTRAAKIADYRPEEHYTALASTPPSWQEFSYTPFGELAAGTTYTAEQLNRYLFEHPLHHTPNGYNPKRSGLQLRIQKNPSDSARRYPTYTSSRCRFKDCYGTHNCINQGQYRVAFDEQTFRNANTDPQHNAGYVHLYCLEKLLDFPLICANLNIRAEKRSLPKEPDARNRMRLGKTDALDGVVKSFTKACGRGELPADYPARNQWRHEGTLTHKLCVAKVEEDGPIRIKAIQDRGEKGSNYTQHLGNLEMESRERAKTRRHQAPSKGKAAPAPKGKGKGKGKRKRRDEESEDDEEEEILPRRTTKRTKAWR